MKTESKKFSAKVFITFRYGVAQEYLDESFSRIGRSNKFFIINGGEIKELLLTDLVKIDEDNDLKNLCNVLGWEVEEAESKDEVIQEIYNSYCVEDVEKFAETLDHEDVSIKENFEIFSTQGYSQGDYAEVIVLDSQKSEGLQQWIDNLFWDAPTSVCVEFDAGQLFHWCGEDINTPQYWNYPYDVEEFKEDLERFLEKEFKYAAAKDRIIKTILDAVPKEIELSSS